MTDEQPQAAAPAKRGEALWKATREAIAERNAKVSKIGIADRKAREQAAVDRRRSAERVEEEALRAKSRARTA